MWQAIISGLTLGCILALSVGPVIFTIVKRKNVRKVISIIRKHNPAAFYSIEDIKNVRKGIFANIQ